MKKFLLTMLFLIFYNPSLVWADRLGNDIDIANAHAAPSTQLEIEADTATDHDKNEIPDAFGKTDSTYIYSVIHPGVKYFPEGRWGYRYWGVFTSFPKREGSREEPIIRVSNDGYTWIHKSGTPEPLYDMSACDTVGYNTSYLSDGDLFLDVEGYLWCVFRSSGTHHKLWVTKYDGSSWDASPTMIIDGDEFLGKGVNADLLSPSVILDVEDSVVTYKLWHLEKLGAAENKIYLAEAPKPDSGWPTDTSSPQSAQCTWIPGGDTTQSDLWHLEVIPCGPECLFALVVQCKESASGYGGNLYVAKSTDGEGKIWTSGSVPFINQTGSAWHNDFVYRASGMFREEGDEIVFDMFYSGRATGTNTIWGTGRTTIYFSDTTFVNIDTADDNDSAVSGGRIE